MKTAGILSLITLLCAVQCHARGDDPDYGANKIPEALLKHANAVVRTNHTEVEISSASEIYYRETLAITILNEKGQRYAHLRQHYDRFTKIQSVSGALYDAGGEEVESLDKKKLVDETATAYHNLADDDKCKYYNFKYVKYPYTVVYEVEKKVTNSFTIDPWIPQNGNDCAVQSADISITWPKDFPLRYRTFHINSQPVVAADADNKKLTLQISDVRAFEDPDALTPHADYPYPTMLIAADHFSVDGETGDMADWKGFGKFVYDINAGRDELTPEAKHIVHTLTDTCLTPRSKISVLYSYLQQNTRYVSIQLGIGGWRSLEASFVAEKGYGDCKALSNYMRAMLKEAGITSYLTVAYAGEQQHLHMIPDFPCHSFNHMILCVPQGADSVWLECTAKDLPPGYLSDFTMDRNVLLLTPAGGYMVKTPSQPAANNLLRRRAIVRAATGDAAADIKSTYRGWWWDKESGLLDEPRSKQEDYLNHKFTIPTYSVKNFSFENIKAVPEVNETVSLTGTGILAANSSHLFLSMQLFRDPLQEPYPAEKRKDSFQLHQNYTVVDTVVYRLDHPCTLDNKPRELNMDFPFGAAQTHISQDNDTTITVCRRFVHKAGTYPPEMYEDYVHFSRAVASSYTGDKMMLTRKN